MVEIGSCLSNMNKIVDELIFILDYIYGRLSAFTESVVQLIEAKYILYLNIRFPFLSAFHAFIRPKSPQIASSMMYDWLLNSLD